MRNSELGRWLSVDPLANKYFGWSPYNYTLNNPLVFVDPDGMDVGDYYDENGNKVGNDGIDDGKAYIANKKGDIEYDRNNYFEILGGISAAKGDYQEGFLKVDNNFGSKINSIVSDVEDDLFSSNKSTDIFVLSESVYPSPLKVIGISGSGKMDMKYRIAGISPTSGRAPITKTMYLIKNKYMNINTAGNFLWGVVGDKWGYSEWQFKMIAEVGSIVQGRLDESHEQKAISMGFNFNK